MPNRTSSKKKYKEWTEEEDLILKERYRLDSFDVLMGLLPDRTRDAIILRANSKGLSRKEIKRFTEEEDNFIRNEYPTHGYKKVSEHLGVKKGIVIARAIKLGVHSSRFRLRTENKTYKGCGLLSLTQWGRVIKGSKKRKLPLEISLEEAWNLFLQQNGICPLTGLTLTFSKTSTGSDGTASFDRIDSKKGYIKGNVQWVHKIVNRMKWNLSEPEFIKFCNLIASKNPLK